MKRELSGAKTRLRIKLRQIFLENLGLKLLSVAIATLLWIYVASEEKTEVSIKVPVRFVNLPENLTVIGDVPSEISVLVAGPRTLVFGLLNRKLEFRVNMRNAKPGVMEVNVAPELLGIRHPLQVVKVSPASFMVEVDRIIEKKVKVVPVIKGKPHEDFTVARTEVDPPVITLKGPASILRDIEEVKTKPVDISGFSVDTENVISPDLSAYPGVTAEPGKVKVIVRVKERYERKTLSGIPVEVRGTPFSYRVIPKTITVTVFGPVSLVRKLKPEHIRAFIDLSGERPGKFRRKAIIEIPEEFTFLDSRPSWFEIYLYRDRMLR